MALKHFDAARFGSKNNGTDDDSPAIARAVTAADGSKGGTVWLDPRRIWDPQTTVTIRSHYPIVIKSEMGGFNNPFVTTQGCVVAGAVGASNPIFRWQKPADAGSAVDAGSGGIEGIVFVGSRDHSSGNGYGRTTANSIGACVQVDNALNFVMDLCQFYGIKGRALYTTEFIGKMLLSRCDSQHCGDTSKPLFDLACSSDGYYFFRDCELEINYAAEYIKVSAKDRIELNNVQFEADSAITTDQTFVDATLNTLIARGCQFRRNGAVHVKLGAESNHLVDSSFDAQAGKTNEFITLTSGAQNSTFDNLKLTGVAGQTGTVLDIAADQCHLNRIEMYVTGKLKVSGVFCELSNIYVRDSLVPSGSYAIDLGSYNTLDNVTVKGHSGSNIAGGGITLSNSKISNPSLYYIAEKGIYATAACSVIGGKAESVTGTVYDLPNGSVLKDSTGHPSTVTASGTGGTSTATLHSPNGQVTTDGITTAAGATHVLTLTNALISTSSVINAVVGYKDATQGTPVIVKQALGAGSVAWTILNAHGASAFNGTNPLRIDFTVTNG